MAHNADGPTLTINVKIDNDKPVEAQLEKLANALGVPIEDIRLTEIENPDKLKRIGTDGNGNIASYPLIDTKNNVPTDSETLAIDDITADEVLEELQGEWPKLTKHVSNLCRHRWKFPDGPRYDHNASPRMLSDARKQIIRQTRISISHAQQMASPKEMELYREHYHAVENAQCILVSRDVALLAHDVLTTTGIDESWLDLIPDNVILSMPRNTPLLISRTLTETLLNDIDSTPTSPLYAEAWFSGASLFYLGNNHDGQSPVWQTSWFYDNPVASFLPLLCHPRKNMTIDAAIDNLEAIQSVPNCAQVYSTFADEPMGVVLYTEDTKHANQLLQQDADLIARHYRDEVGDESIGHDLITVQIIRFAATILALAKYSAFTRRESVTTEEPTKRERKMARRENRPEPQPIRVETIYVTAEQPTPKATTTSHAPVEYHHRWIVSGHFRNQTYGPNNSLRRRQWIPPYIKGPAGAPLLNRTKILSIR